MPKKFHIPERSCVFCKHKFPKKTLTRFCLKNNCITIDETQKEQGRGAYVCFNCLSYIEKPKFFKKLCKALKLDSSDTFNLRPISLILSSLLYSISEVLGKTL